MRLYALGLAVLAVTGAVGGKAATLYPYLDPVQVMAADQLAAQPPDAKTRAALRKTLRLIDAPGQPSLAKDLRLLSVVGPALMKTGGSASFSEPLNSAVDRYLVLLMAAVDLRAANLAAIPPSQPQAAAQRSLESLNTLLAAINETGEVAQACRLLRRAAPRLATTDKLITKATNPPPSAQHAKDHAGDTSGNSFSWLVISAPGVTPSPYTGGLRVVVYGGDNGWGYLIRW